MTLSTELPSLLRRAVGYLDGLTDPTCITAECGDSRADAVEEALDPKTKAELLRRWFSA
jgi:hypothetical protein